MTPNRPRLVRSAHLLVFVFGGTRFPFKGSITLTRFTKLRHSDYPTAWENVSCPLLPSGDKRDTDRSWWNPRRKRSGWVAVQSLRVHTAAWWFGSTREQNRHRCANPVFRWHRPRCFGRLCFVSLRDRAWAVWPAGMSRCREDSPDRSVEQRPCRGIDRNTKSFESITPFDTVEHICWIRVSEESSLTGRKWFVLSTLATPFLSVIGELWRIGEKKLKSKTFTITFILLDLNNNLFYFKNFTGQ